MASLELQGNNLGEKHRYYNELLKTAIEEYPLDLPPIDYHDSDVNNMLKIDVACSRKDIKYILEVLKCEDMLYVSKTIKNINWLLTDEEYANMINPKHLHSELFPEMTTKAINKLLLHIRLNLKNETRVEEFFNYYKNTNINLALKWLPNCSSTLIENAVKTYNAKISVNILKRLCEKSIKYLTIYFNCKSNKRSNYKQIMQETMFLIQNHASEYLDILETLNEKEYPSINAKYTKILMKNAPQRVQMNFIKFAKNIHLQTFVKYLEPDAIIAILLQNCENNILKMWFTEDILDIFLNALPEKRRSDFVKEKVFENAKQEQILMLVPYPVQSNRWYKYVEFETAFKDIVEFIKKESSSKERMILMEILLFSAKKNLQHVEELIQYFRVNHINESLVYKKKFITAVVQKHDTFRLSDQAWENLYVLFLSVEDLESEKTEQSFIKAAIIRKIINNESVPENLEKTFNFDTLKSYKKKLNENECDLIFNYLYNYAMKKYTDQENMSSEIEFKKAIAFLKKVLSLLSDWEKDLANYPEVINAITQSIHIKKTQFKDVDISSFYNVKKSWRKYLFSMSLDLSLSQEVCLNALKHDSQLLLDSNHVTSLLARSDITDLQKLLNKIRIYWPMLANDAISFCLDNLDNRGDKALIKHIMYLLPVDLLKDIVQKYVPEEETINWNEDIVLLNKRKNIAKCIHIARPQPPIEFVLWYAKGDYLQFALTSLNSMLYNMSEVKARTCMQELMDSPVSLQKHVIRIAIDKLKCKEYVQLFRNAWDKTKNKSVRAELFKTTFKSLCREKDTVATGYIWKLFSYFIKCLTNDENSSIYNTLTKANEVPSSIKEVFWTKSANFFKTRPVSFDSGFYIRKILYTAGDFADVVQTSLLTQLLLRHFADDILTMSYNPEFIASCVLSTDNIEDHLERYYEFLVPVMEVCFKSWHTRHNNRYVYKETFYSILAALCSGFKYVVIEKEMLIPDVAFNKILKYLGRLPFEENYVLLRSWKLSCKLMEIIASNISQNLNDDVAGKDLNEQFVSVISKALPQLAEEIQKCLREDIKRYYPSIYICMGHAIQMFIAFYNFDKPLELLLLKSILCADQKETYFLVLHLVSKTQFFHFEATREIMDIISSHPSKEVKFHYNNRLNIKFN